MNAIPTLTQLYPRFASRLSHVIQHELPIALLRKVDVEDVLQSALGSFLRRNAEESWFIANDVHLWSILRGIVENKCKRVKRYYSAACRDNRREDAIDTCHIPVDTRMIEQVLANELREFVLMDLNDRDRQVVLMYLDGWTIGEAAEWADCAERTARRAIERIRKRLVHGLIASFSEQTSEISH